MASSEEEVKEKVVYPLPVIWPVGIKAVRKRIQSASIVTLGEHRRSSIPFYGRDPKVKFDSFCIYIDTADKGPYEPHLSAENVPHIKTKSLLKDTNYEHAILVDLKKVALMKVHESNQMGKQMSADDIMYCAAVAENACSSMANTERLMRGALDILTFPDPSRHVRVHLLARLKVGFVVIMNGINRILDGPPPPGFKKTNGYKRLEEELEETKLIAKVAMDRMNKLHKSVKTSYKEWTALLKKRGDFKTRSVRTSHSVYKGGKMPESVSLFEDGIDLDLYAGSATISWTLSGLIITSDVYASEDNEIDFMAFEMEDRLDIVSEVLGLIRGIIKLSENSLELGADYMSEGALVESFKALTVRMLHVEFDSTYDPLAAQELKYALGELVQRKSELVNVAKRANDAFEWVYSFVLELILYCQQKLAGLNQDNKPCLRGLFCCCMPKFIEYGDLMNRMWSSLAFFHYEIPQTESLAITLLKCKGLAKSRRARLAEEEHLIEGTPSLMEDFAFLKNLTLRRDSSRFTDEDDAESETQDAIQMGHNPLYDVFFKNIYRQA